MLSIPGEPVHISEPKSRGSRRVVAFGEATEALLRPAGVCRTPRSAPDLTDGKYGPTPYPTHTVASPRSPASTPGSTTCGTPTPACCSPSTSTATSSKRGWATPASSTTLREVTARDEGFASIQLLCRPYHKPGGSRSYSLQPVSCHGDLSPGFKRRHYRCSCSVSGAENSPTLTESRSSRWRERP